MAILKAPKDCSAVTTSSKHSFNVVDGFIDTKDAPTSAVQELYAHGCTLATDQEIAEADLQTVLEPARGHAAQQKASIISQLKELGVPFDGRANLASLRQTLDEAHEAMDEQRPRGRKTATHPLLESQSGDKTTAGGGDGAGDDKGAEEGNGADGSQVQSEHQG